MIDRKIRAIARRIATNYHAEKIILFGSHAWGVPTDESDVDLLVIKRSAQSRIERQRSLRALLSPSSASIDLLVYTPQELRRKITRDRNLFLADIVDHGTILYDADTVR